MKKLTLLLLIGTFFVLLTGCLQSEIEVTVNTDGSGTIRQTFLLSGELTAMMNFGSMGMSEEEEEDNTFSLYDEDELKAMTSALGEGVTYVSSESISTDWGEGFQAEYSFTNINNVRVNQNPGEFVPSGMTSMGMEEEPEEDDTVTEYITFDFKKGNPSVLTINLPNQYDEDTPAADDTGSTEEEMDNSELMMMKEFFRGMRIAMTIDFNGNIVKTNASYREDSKVVLLDMDFSKLMENEDAFMKLMRTNPETIEETKNMFEDTEGMKAEFKETVTVSFK
jgi:hypothetical protein